MDNSALNGSLQRENSLTGEEIVLQIGLPRTLGQIKLWLQQLNERVQQLKERHVSLSASHIVLSQQLIQLNKHQQQLSPGLFQLSSAQFHLPQCPGQMNLSVIFTTKGEFSEEF